MSEVSLPVSPIRPLLTWTFWSSIVYVYHSIDAEPVATDHTLALAHHSLAILQVFRNYRT
jgi:hypothetical protein